MAGYQKVVICGHLGADPDVYEGKDFKSATLSVATTRVWYKKDKKQEHTSWHRIKLFGRLAEIAEEYLQKGSMALIDGRLNYFEYENKDGEKKFGTEIIGEALTLISSGEQQKSSKKRRSRKPEPEEIDDEEEEEDDDVPF